MLLFMLMLIPMVSIIYFTCTTEKRILSLFFIGAISAAILCGVKVFLFYAHRLVPFDLKENFMLYLVRQCLLPSVIIYMVFLIIARDDGYYKSRAAFPLLASFYSVYLPYNIISATESVYSAYSLFVKPVVYLSMIAIISISIFYIYDLGFKKRKFWFIPIGLIFIGGSIVFPAYSEALYSIDSDFVLNCVYCILFALLPFAYVVVRAVLYFLSAKNKA